MPTQGRKYCRQARRERQQARVITWLVPCTFTTHTLQPTRERTEVPFACNKHSKSQPYQPDHQKCSTSFRKAGWRPFGTKGRSKDGPGETAFTNTVRTSNVNSCTSVGHIATMGWGMQNCATYSTTSSHTSELSPGRALGANKSIRFVNQFMG